MGFSVPKKKFRRAVQRNKVKRLLREAWRLNKQLLYIHIPADKQIHLFINFAGTELPEYATVYDAVVKAVDRLKKEFPVSQ